MKILIVDDEPGLAVGLANLLKENGFEQARAAASGTGADHVIKELGGIDVLVTDVIMEGEDGFALSERLTAQDPNLKTVFISGYDLSDYTDRIGTAPLIQKPIDGDNLGAVLKQLAIPVAATPTP
ncbi:MAG: response regulator, partial [Chthoniobacterales bacterium]